MSLLSMLTSGIGETSMVALSEFLSLSLSPSPHMHTVRLSAQDLLSGLCMAPGLSSHCHTAIIPAMEKHLQETTRSNSPHWWKVSS